MAAPSTTALGTPAGITLKDGFSTAYAFALLPTFSIWETDVGIIGVVGGEAIKTTNMRNTAVHTRYPRTLYDTTPIEGTCQYDPNALNQAISTLINRNGSITCHLPDGSTTDFWGFLEELKPQNVKEGDQPLAKFKITPTNWDHTNRVEAVPVITSVAGT